ncbi:MAG: PAS domain-containing protein [Deltaproteobacteria bacterium]|nr:PAS domain-containing protein [Deltaproteobacteria bacterium]
MSLVANARYRQLVEGMSQGAIITTRAGEILFANAAFATMAGEEIADVAKTPLAERVSARDLKAIFSLLRNESRHGVEVQLQCCRGTPVSVRISLVQDTDDTLTFLLTDLTGRRAAAEAEEMLDAIRAGQVDAFVVGDVEIQLLSSNHSPYRALVERMRQGAVAVTSTGEIVFVNERFAAMVGLPQDGFIGGHLGNFIDDSARGVWRDMLASSEPVYGEMLLRKMAGGHVSVIVTVSQLDEHCLFLFNDMTERKRHEAADNSSTRFLGILGQELADILQPLGRSLAKIQESTALEPELRALLDQVVRQADRMHKLVGDLRRINPG